VSLHKKLRLAGVVAFFAAGPLLAQGSIGVGATIGLVNDVGGNFHVDEFKSKDVNIWADYEVQEKVLVRAMLGTLKVKGANAGKDVTLVAGGPTVTLPDLTEHIDYATVGVSYLFSEGGYTSGLFAGFGGYKVRPDSVAAEFANYRDQRETAFGWHGGVEGGMQIVSRLSFMVRLTYHNIRSESGRSLLTANAGFGYRF
jgi:Outer membrane protein beta-barrel domain